MSIYRKTSMRVLILLAIVSLLAIAASPLPVPAGPGGMIKKPAAKNIIVMIADGRGFNHVTAASYYETGKFDRQIYNRFPFRFAVSTYPAYYEGDPCYGKGYDPVAVWKDFTYVKSCYTDSAAAATALATGVKTYEGAIGVDLNKMPLKNVVQVAEERGKATGVITSVPLSHATPAGFVAHNVDRENLEAIAQEMIYQSGLEVLMGAGNPYYDADGELITDPANFDFEYVGGQATWDDLVAGTAGAPDNWTLIQTRAEFRALQKGPTPKRVIGVPQVYETLQQGRGGDAWADPFVVPFIKTVPTLVEMTNAALNVLDNDPDGFFLMIEGGAIDWAAHDNQSGRMIEEHIDFDNAVEAVVKWVNTHSNWGETMLIVTNDHETGYLTGPGSDPTWTPIINHGAGHLPGMQWNYDDHTNSLVPIFAKGDAARMFTRYANHYDPVHGRYIDNTDIAKVVFWAIGP